MKPRLSFKQILEWADAHRERTGEWPTNNSGPVLDAPGETWRGIGHVLDRGSRGLIRPSSMAQLLDEYRSVPNSQAPRSLSIEEILSWADAYYKRTGQWPCINSGAVPEAKRILWRSINRALEVGSCGLPGGMTLCQLLAKHRGKRNPKATPRLSIKQIRAWAAQHHKRTGEWPTCQSGPVLDAPGETWGGIGRALGRVSRGLRRRSTLGRLFGGKLGATNRWAHHSLSVETVLAWADAYKKSTGKWPIQNSGPIPEAKGLSWQHIDRALQVGTRGLPGGLSVAQLLVKHRGKRDLRALPPLTIKQILAWADAHHDRTGHWPTTKSGPVHDEPDETWLCVDYALHAGTRGLSRTVSLARVLTRYRGTPTRVVQVRPKADRHFNSVSKYRRPPGRVLLPRLTFKQILAWADAHHDRTSDWPTQKSGPVHDSPNETWSGIAHALQRVSRGLRRRSSIPQLLAKHRNVPNHLAQPPLSVKTILAWADAHKKRTGRWPSQQSGPIPEADGKPWCNIDMALTIGARGLPGGMSLSRLLLEHRGKRNYKALPRLSVKQILSTKKILLWADLHHERTGTWPTERSGAVRDSPGETWSAISQSLRRGQRGLPAGWSVSRLLAEHRGVPRYQQRPILTVDEILKWADSHHERTGKWPSRTTGPVQDSPGESWSAIDRALRGGRRGLPGGGGLRGLIAKHRGVSTGAWGQRLTLEQILAWADAHHKRNGTWPKARSGAVHGVPNEKWYNINYHLYLGGRGLEGGSSLPKLLWDYRAVANRGTRPRLSIKVVQEWAIRHYKKTGKWPNQTSGPVRGIPDETWGTIDAALRSGRRGLPSGSSLFKILGEFRRRTRPRKAPKVKKRPGRPSLTLKQVVAWANAHHKRTGQWPRASSGRVYEDPNEKWATINGRLRTGGRGFKGGYSLAQLLWDRLGVPNPAVRPRLYIKDIQEWAIQHHVETGAWPVRTSGPVRGTKHETWAAINESLKGGHRGLAGGSSLSKVLSRLRRRPRPRKPGRARSNKR